MCFFKQICLLADNILYMFVRSLFPHILFICRANNKYTYDIECSLYDLWKNKTTQWYKGCKTRVDINQKYNLKVTHISTCVYGYRNNHKKEKIYKLKIRIFEYVRWYLCWTKERYVWLKGRCDVNILNEKYVNDLIWWVSLYV